MPPLYARIEQALRTRLSTASPGDPLPSEPTLAAEFGVARMTVRAALDRLAADGLVERVPGRGTFVRPRPAPRPAGTLMSFHDQVRSWGQVPSSRVVEAALRQATADERASLRLGPGAQVVSIVRVRLAGATPLALEHACFPPHLAHLLELDLERESLHRALRERGLRPTLGSSTLTAEAAGPHAGLLDVPATEPLLVETRLIADQRAEPLERTVSRYVGSRYALQVTFDVEAGP
ncbi:GntR family transcriptional regulator [Pseudonocardia hierapolitana]|uniref:GntR family transcriptional regulator n=1 Tax=Pseudonocardia hierapolitana TaxID=1128676 RepID=A0A561T2U1_9PSEU|nr:GntR family transcriptional regulator [Pseudonocardia hierapolitana]TWF81426.1 GntR family transcriptional regulator [Pseudonocardia hierapolitana]